MKNNLYIASCTEDGGIYRYELQGDTPVFLEKIPCDSPMYSVIENNKLYTVLCESGKRELSALEVRDIINGGELSEVKFYSSTSGKAGCHLAVRNERIYAVNYDSGSVFATPDLLVTHQSRDYTEGMNKKRQEMPHTHCVINTPDGKFLVVTDLGLDKIFIYDPDLNLVSETKVQDGLGPRHVIFDGDVLYCLCELGNALLSFKYKVGKLSFISKVSTLPEGFEGYDIAAAVKIFGDKIYCSNRGHNSIAVFERNENLSSPIGFINTEGDEPRDFTVVGDVLICTNQFSSTVKFFKLNEKGLADKAYHTLSIPQPLCVVYKKI